MKQIIHMKVIAGQPTDGSGQVAIHLFVPDIKGLFVEPCVLYPRLDKQGQRMGNQLINKPTRGGLACDPKRKFESTTVKGVTTVTPRTDDPRAVTCPRCIASSPYKIMMETLEKLLNKDQIIQEG